MALVEQCDIFFAREFLAVGRNRVYILSGKIERRRIVIAWGEIARLAS